MNRTSVPGPENIEMKKTHSCSQYLGALTPLTPLILGRSFHSLFIDSLLRFPWPLYTSSLSQPYLYPSSSVSTDDFTSYFPEISSSPKMSFSNIPDSHLEPLCPSSSLRCIPGLPLSWQTLRLAPGTLFYMSLPHFPHLQPRNNGTPFICL